VVVVLARAVAASLTTWACPAATSPRTTASVVRTYCLACVACRIEKEFALQWSKLCQALFSRGFGRGE
jgi:hypothetical protein